MAIDETGNVYGRLTVIERDYSKPNSIKKAFWKCQCECGNETIVQGVKLRNGETKSCGCLRSIKAKQNVVDITGQKFGRLLVIERDKSSNSGIATWKCKCDCGNEIIAFGSNLRSGHTKSCGCLTKDVISSIKKGDIINQRFGKLTALERTNDKKGTNYIWHCKCDCGNDCYIDINSLTQKKVISCGCVSISNGEYEIQNLLLLNNINFVREKNFESCRSPWTNALLRFDFYVNNQYLIEFDGRQHFFELGGPFEGSFKATRERDLYKNNWCKENNIPLIRIPYTHLKDLCIDDLLLEKSSFIFKGDEYYAWTNK